MDLLKLSSPGMPTPTSRKSLDSGLSRPWVVSLKSSYSDHVESKRQLKEYQKKASDNPFFGGIVPTSTPPQPPSPQSPQSPQSPVMVVKGASSKLSAANRPHTHPPSHSSPHTGGSSSQVRRPSLSTADARRPSISTADARRPSLSTADSRRPSLTTADARRPSLSSSDATRRPSISSCDTRMPSLASSDATRRPSVSSSDTRRPSVSTDTHLRPLPTSSEELAMLHMQRSRSYSHSSTKVPTTAIMMNSWLTALSLPPHIPPPSQPIIQTTSASNHWPVRVTTTATTAGGSVLTLQPHPSPPHHAPPAPPQHMTGKPQTIPTRPHSPHSPPPPPPPSTTTTAATSYFPKTPASTPPLSSQSIKHQPQHILYYPPQPPQMQYPSLYHTAHQEQPVVTFNGPLRSTSLPTPSPVADAVTDAGLSSSSTAAAAAVGTSSSYSQSQSSQMNVQVHQPFPRVRQFSETDVASAMAASAAATAATKNSYQSTHEFSEYNYKSPTYCDVCDKFLWGLMKQGCKCAHCGLNAHTGCVALVSSICSNKNSTSSPNTSREPALVGTLHAAGYI